MFKNTISDHDIINGGQQGLTDLRCRVRMHKSRAPGSPGH